MLQIYRKDGSEASFLSEYGVEKAYGAEDMDRMGAEGMEENDEISEIGQHRASGQ